MNTGVVLLSYNSEKDVLRLLDELSFVRDIYIVVVDNSEKKSLKLEEIENFNNEYKYIFNESNLGYYNGNLVGIKYLFNKKKIEKVLVLNPDVGAENWEEIILKLKSNFTTKNSFIVGPRVRIPECKDVSSPKPKFKFYKEIFYNFLFPISYIFLRSRQTKMAKKKGKVFTVEGSVYIVDAIKYIEIEKYFKKIFLYGEEVIFGLLAEKNGWEIYFDNTLEVLHYHPPRKESKIYDKYYLKSMEEIAHLFHLNFLIEKVLIFSIKYKKNIKKLILRLKAMKFIGLTSKK